MQEISYTADGGDEKPTVDGEAVQRLSTAGWLPRDGGTKRRSGIIGARITLVEAKPWQEC